MSETLQGPKHVGLPADTRSHSAGLVARQHGQVARATQIKTLTKLPLGRRTTLCLINAMIFVGCFNELRLDALVKHSLATGTAAVRQSLAQSRLSLTDFAQLLAPAGAELLEPLCRKSQQLTQQRFGKVIRLFAPLYLSNECI